MLRQATNANRKRERERETVSFGIKIRPLNNFKTLTRTDVSSILVVNSLALSRMEETETLVEVDGVMLTIEVLSLGETVQTVAPALVLSTIFSHLLMATPSAICLVK